jgi:hypothetical protein
VRYVVIGAAHELTRDNVRAAEVVALIPEFIGHEDEKPRLQPSHHAAVNERCDEVPRRLRRKRRDLLHVGMAEQGLSTLVQFGDQARRLRS